MLSLQEFRNEINAGAINTVVVGAVDMQGRLIGKRMTGRYFDETGSKGMSSCNYLLAMNIEGHPMDGFEITNWSKGFANCIYKPDLSSLRKTPWMEATALVICDILEKNSLTPLYPSPRAILQQQVARLAQRGMTMRVASELEFYVFDESQKSAMEKRWKMLCTTSPPHHRCLHLLAGSAEEPFMRNLRNNLNAAGIPLEATHPEYGPGQQELNFVPADPVTMADRHIIAKMGVHEIAQQSGLAATFMAKYNRDKPGSACHIHMSLWSADEKTSLFWDSNAEYGMSKLMRQWTAGLVNYAREYIYFLAPYINSYKRLQPNSWAPTKICWALDNRTGAFRLCNENSQSVHLECRVGGADLNPYLAYAALIAAGLAGIDEDLEAGTPSLGNIYAREGIPELPGSLRIATEELSDSKMLNEALGRKVVEHYVNAACKEQEEFDQQVTDWELMRGFDRN